MKPLTPRAFISGEKVTVSIRLPEQLANALHSIAEARGHSFSSFVQEGLDQWALAHHKSRPKNESTNPLILRFLEMEKARKNK